MKNSVIKTKEFNREIGKINVDKSLKHKSAVLEISAKYPEIYFVAWFSSNGESLKKVSAYENYADAKFYSDKSNGWVFLNAKIA